MKNCSMILWCIILILFCSFSIQAKESGLKTSKVYHGFKLLQKKQIDEINGEGLLFEHVKSGARLVKLYRDDNNHTFSVSFKTIPNSHEGIPHIIEHSVLNGSKNFPVKNTYDELTKGSLRTFINALTSKHWTMYPISSKNKQDFYNLMHVYLDAVFFPRIYDDERIFKQEGWHYEMESDSSDLVYNGVVYNEMKGAYSNPSRILSGHLYRNLMPQSPYHFESGGHPDEITDLTYQEFLDFHRTYYHPVNSYIYLSGSNEVLDELKFIDEKYLSQFEKNDKIYKIALQPEFSEIKKVTEYYPVSQDENLADKTYLTMSFICGQSKDNILTTGLMAAFEALFTHPSAPLRRALKDAGIGKDISGSFDSYKQNIITIVVNNANASDADRFQKIVEETVANAVKNGLDKKLLKGILNNIEFNLREGESGRTPKSIVDNMDIMNGWMFANDPFDYLEYEKRLPLLKNGLKNKYYERLVKKYFLNNKSAMLMVMEPKKGMSEERDARQTELLAKKRASLSKDEIAKIVADTKALKEYQETPSSAEEIQSLPILSLDDISKDAETFEVDKRTVAGTDVLAFPTFANNITYLRMYFDLNVLPQELMPYAALLSSVLIDLNTENYTYDDLNKEIDIQTGGINTFVLQYSDAKEKGKFYPKFIVHGKVLTPNLEKLMNLQAEVMLRSKLNDKKRLKEVLTQLDSRMDRYVRSNGIGVAQTRLLSYLTPGGYFDEITDGMSYAAFIADIARNFDEKADTIIVNLEKVSKLLFNKDNMTVGITCSEDDYQKFKKSFKNLKKQLGEEKPMPQKYVFEQNPADEGLQATSRVQYVVKGYNFKDLGYDYSGKMVVMQQILSREYLLKYIRIMGGAYGGWASLGRNGNLYFNSYRDPNLAKTLENYDNAPKFLEEFSASEKEMARYIIGTLSRREVVYTPSSKGRTAWSNYFRGITAEDVQKERDEMLSTTSDDVKNYAKLIKEIMEKEYYCVYGNEEKIKENEKLFKKVLKVAN